MVWDGNCAWLGVGGYMGYPKTGSMGHGLLKIAILSIPKNESQSNPHKGYAVTLKFYVPIAPSHPQASLSAFAFFSLTP